ncbi:PREDICTED: activin receptor type-1-like, partial [Priapulus caudatus]|uniref:receptor protein serine/threonine kinase n=1 Tax=Priapulus caudatus TaxID=37621 RepID=A0ABM1EUC8_PRICU
CLTIVRDDCGASPVRIQGCESAAPSPLWVCPPGDHRVHILDNSLIQCCHGGDFCNSHLLPTRPGGCLTPGSDVRQAENTISLTVQIVAPLVAMVLVLIGFLYMMIRFHKNQLTRYSAARSVDRGDPAPPGGDYVTRQISELSSGSGVGVALLVQRTIGRDIRLIRRIGQGRFCEVWRGECRWGDVAVKIYASRDEGAWSREEGVYEAALLQHDNVVRYMGSDLVSVDGCTQYWLLLQYHGLGSLYDFLMVNIVDAAALLRFMCSAASGLTHLHTRLHGIHGKLAVAHRDLKSRNILVKDNGQCCIADFGLSILQRANGSLDIDDNVKVGTKRLAETCS